MRICTAASRLTAITSSPLPPVTESKGAVKLALIAMVVVLSNVWPQQMRVGCERGLACMPGRKLTALRYGSVSAIGDRVTDVTSERSAGMRQRQQGKKVQQKSQQISQ